MTNIIAIGTAVPAHKHNQSDILAYMLDAYDLETAEGRKLSFLYRHCEIESRYSVLPDFSKESLPQLFSKDADIPNLERRMALYDKHAPLLSIEALRNAMGATINVSDITHLITVSCTGMSAPGLDLQILTGLKLKPDVFRTSVNFMGCYGAIHGLKMANYIVQSDSQAIVAVVATELCTLHFQHAYTPDNAGSSLLFGDGSAAVIVSNRDDLQPLARINSFYSTVAEAGREDMSWKLSSHGFLMRLSAYVPKLIEHDIEPFVHNALPDSIASVSEVQHWCIHPGGKKILDNIESRLKIASEKMAASRSVLKRCGNMSSPTVLFVLEELIAKKYNAAGPLVGMAFGPGLTLESFTGEVL